MGPPAARSLARRNGAGTNRACAECQERTRTLGRSFLFPFVFVEQTAKFFELFLGAVASGERVEHQFAGGTLENALHHVCRELLLGLLHGLSCYIDVSAPRFAAGNEAVCG